MTGLALDLGVNVPDLKLQAYREQFMQEAVEILNFSVPMGPVPSF